MYTLPSCKNAKLSYLSYFMLQDVCSQRITTCPQDVQIAKYFVLQIAKCICSNFKIYLSKLPKCICSNWKMQDVCSQPLATCPQDAFINRQQKQPVRIITGQKSSQSRPLSKSTLAKKRLIAFFTQPHTAIYSNTLKLNLKLNRLRITVLDLYRWTLIIYTPPLFKVIFHKHLES